MLDADNRNAVHWLMINIPESELEKGEVISEYDSPTPKRGRGPHRYVIMALEQRGQGSHGSQDRHLRSSDLTEYRGSACRGQAQSKGQSEEGQSEDSTGYSHLEDLSAFRSQFGLEEPVAANYFTVEYDAFVESILEYCDGRKQQ